MSPDRCGASSQHPLKFKNLPPRSGGEIDTAGRRLTLVRAVSNVNVRGLTGAG